MRDNAFRHPQNQNETRRPFRNPPPPNNNIPVVGNSHRPTQLHEKQVIQHPSNSREESTPKPARDFFEIPVYGKRSATQFKVSDTKGGWHTISIEGAQRKNPNNPTDKSYDWHKTKKISLQITDLELPILIALFNGYIPSCEYKNHGPQNDKGFSIVRQDDRGGYFLELFQKDKAKVALPIGYIEGMHIGHTALTQYMKNFPTLTSDTVLRSIGQLVKALGAKNKLPLKRA